MPNQMPFNFYGPNIPNMNNIPNFQGYNNGYQNQNYDLESQIENIKKQINVLELKIANIEQELKNKNNFDYQTSMHMM